MCFDHATRKCVFSELFPDNHCKFRHNAKPYFEGRTGEEVVPTAQHLPTVDLPEQQNEVLKDILHGKPRQDDTVVFSELGPTPPFLYDFYIRPQALQQVASPNELIVEDNSLFPAWAIALLSFCGVIVVMLVVLILY